MLHKNYTQSNLAYAGDSLIDEFTTDGLGVNGTLSSWKSYNSDKAFTISLGSDPTTQRIGCQLDDDNIKCLMFRKGIYSNDLPWWRLHSNATSTRSLLKLGDYFTKENFSIQMTATFEVIGNWFSMLGLAYDNNPVGLMMGQSDGGLIGFGFFPVTVGGVANKHVRVQINPLTIGTNKFNWAITYGETYHWQSGITEGRLFLYINGASVGSVVMPVGWNFATAVSTNVTGLSLGYAYYGANRHMQGNIYSLLTYNKMLSDDEVMNNYLIDKAKYLIP